MRFGDGFRRSVDQGVQVLRRTPQTLDGMISGGYSQACLLRWIIAALLAPPLVGPSFAQAEHAPAAGGVALTVHPTDGGSLETKNNAFDTDPFLQITSPLDGKHVPFETDKGGALSLSYEVFASALLLQSIKAEVCIHFELLQAIEADSGEPESARVESHRNSSLHCFPGRARELQAAGLAPGDYRLHATLSVAVSKQPEHVDAGMSASVRFRVLLKVPFVPSYEWQRVEDWQEVMSGLDVKMPIGGSDFRRARIPHTWKLQVFVIDDMGKAKGAGRFARVNVRRSDRMSSVRAAIAASVLSRGTCLTLSIGGSRSAWASLEASEEATVEGVKLFEQGLEIAGVVDRESGICACDPPEKGRACQAVLGRLEACEHEASTEDEGGGADACGEQGQSVADCFTNCSVQSDPYESSATQVPEKMLPRTVGDPPPPLQKGWSELQWGSHPAWPSETRWARCRLCSYVPGSIGGLVVHSPQGSGLQLNVPGDLARSRHARWFRTQRASHPAPKVWRHEQYDESSTWCGSGKRVVSSPVCVVAVWDILNVHKLLADLVLPLYHMIWTTYGSFRDDVLLFLEVGHPDQAPRLQQLLKEAATRDTPLRMLSSLTQLPIASAARFERGFPAGTDAPLCIRDLHLGLDLRNTSTAFASGRFPLPFDSASPQGLESSRWQQILSEHVLQALAKESGKAAVVPLPPGVLFIKRLQTRKFKNFIELKAASRKVVKEAAVKVMATTTTTRSMAVVATDATVGAAYPLDWKGWTQEAVLERLTFTQQLVQLSGTTVLVAIHGQGAANAVFLRPGSSLLLIIPPGLEVEKFMFANLALASGVHVFLLESEVKLADKGTTADSNSSQLEKARSEKDVWVDPARFEIMLQAAVAYAARGSSKDAGIRFWDDLQLVAAEEDAAMRADPESGSLTRQTVQQQQAQAQAQILRVQQDIIDARAHVADLERRLASLQTLNVGPRPPEHTEL